MTFNTSQTHVEQAEQTEESTGGRRSYGENIQSDSPCGVPRLTVHSVPFVGQQLRQGPEGVFLIHVHQQQGSDLTHALAVAHLLQATENTQTKILTS